MTRMVSLKCILLIGSLLIGCKKDRPPAAKPAPRDPNTDRAVTPPEPNVPKPPELDPAARGTQTALAEVLAAIREGRLDEAETKLKALEAKSASLPKSLQDQIAAARKSLDAAKTAKAASDSKAKAEAALKEVLALIREGKLDEADAKLKTLEGDSASLPQPLRDQIAAARESLDAAKTAKAAAESKAEAESLLAKILALIKDGKLGDAEKLLKTLEEKAASLPDPLPSKIKAARTALTAKKAASAGGIGLPGLPK